MSLLRNPHARITLRFIQELWRNPLDRSLSGLSRPRLGQARAALTPSGRWLPRRAGDCKGILGDMASFTPEPELTAQRHLSWLNGKRTF